MKFTIVTAALNSAATIGETLSSVLRQKDVEIESIVIDGGSRDDTLKIVASFGDRIAQVVSEPDRSPYDAMQEGLMRATGDVVAFLNGDDYYADDRVLRDVATALETTGATAAAGTVEQFRADTGRIVRTIRASAYRPSRMRWGVVPPHPGLFVKTSLARQAGGIDPQFMWAGDFDLFMRMSRQPDFRLTVIPRTLTMMRVGGLSTAGKLIYLRMASELRTALAKNGYTDGNWRIQFRLLWKLPELFTLRRQAPRWALPTREEGEHRPSHDSAG
jgi:glycosyltransferase involved in cell wall biosynthesis